MCFAPMIDLREYIAHRLDRDVTSLTPRSGGDVANAFRVELGSGKLVFAKTHHNAPPGFFTTEAAGLAWLREVDAVPVPEVLAVSDDPPVLILEWIDEGRPGRQTERDFGHALAALHASGAACFGREDRRSTGSRGHREFDLAMMRLFGGFGDDCFSTYAEISPLAVGWEHRIPLHQLAPLAVHAIKFGGGYVNAIVEALNALRRPRSSELRRARRASGVRIHIEPVHAIPRLDRLQCFRRPVRISRRRKPQHATLIARREAGLEALGSLTGLGPEGVPAAVEPLGDVGRFAVDYLFGQIWSRPQLPPRDRSLITLTALVTLGKVAELDIHVPGALRNGLAREQIEEVILQLTLYAGYPAAVEAIRATRRIFAQFDASGSDD